MKEKTFTPVANSLNASYVRAFAVMVFTLSFLFAAVSTSSANGGTIKMATASGLVPYKNLDHALEDRNLPEIAVNAGYKITPQARLFVSYAFLYVSNVVRPGEQINRNINPTQTVSWGNDPPATLVSPGGTVVASSGFTAELFARSPRGRERAKLEVELCPAQIAFGNAACTKQQTPNWVDLGTTDVALSTYWTSAPVPGLSPTAPTKIEGSTARMAARNSAYPS